MRLLQGRGALPMPDSRRLPGGAVVLRPLLNVPKREIRRVAEALGATWIEDSSNSALHFDRNFLRLEVLPRLARRWPNAKAALVDAGRSKAVHDALLSHLLDAQSLALGELPAEFQVPALRAWLARFGESGASDRALAEFAAQLSARADAQPELRLARGSLRRWRGLVRYAPFPPVLQSSYALQPPGVLALPHGELSIEAAQEGGFHAAGAVEVRFRQGGERLALGGRSHSLKAPAAGSRRASLGAQRPAVDLPRRGAARRARRRRGRLAGRTAPLASSLDAQDRRVPNGFQHPAPALAEPSPRGRASPFRHRGALRPASEIRLGR